MKPYTFENSDALMERARKVVPGGIYGHQTPLVLTKGAYPSFFARGEGSHIWDVDGNEYIDYMCSYGPIVLGHRHPKVEEAARRQMELGNCFNAPGPVWVELAEHLVSITPFADWTVFAKNGSDVCTWATEVARHATGRPKIAMCSGAYHGTHAWCTPMPGRSDAGRSRERSLFSIQRSREPPPRGRGKQRQDRGRNRVAVQARRRSRLGAAGRRISVGRAKNLRRQRHRPHPRRRSRRLPPAHGRLGRVVRQCAPTSRLTARLSPTAIRSPHALGATA